ncbi:MAG: hypothetical protein J6C06_04560 [Lachnospiraceae bacterium]|nr:hypothetical protein [Lachnospiraceae bacterium]
MCTDTTDKIELPLTPSPHIMELLIKAKHFLEHAIMHAQTGNSFDTMIAIHSLDNSIEYLLRILIKHLEIEEKTGKAINTPELMGLFSEVDKFLKERTLLDGKKIGLPFENEVRQLRVLRNNVQHGLILPIGELKMFIDYGERFFDKILSKVFGLTAQEIAYSTLIENGDIKAHLVAAEQNIVMGRFLDAIVACRDAFELGDFLLRHNSHHYNKMAVMPHLKQESIELYWYIESLEQEISILGTNINPADYRLYRRYIDHIPGEYRAIKTGYTVMQREWEKRDADFCYAFVAQAILYWQLTQEKPLYEVDMSGYPVHKHNKKIDGVSIPEIYPKKACIYVEDECMGQLMLVSDEVKEKLQKISPGQICYFENEIINAKSGAIFRKYNEYISIDACEFNLILNNGPLWEFVLFYRIIPFTTISDMEEQINIDHILEYKPQNEVEEKFKDIVIEFGSVDTAERAFELKELLSAEEFFSVNAKGVYSSKLIDILSLD